MAAAAMTLAVCAAGAPAEAASTYTFRGRGWGHGLGMSQWGARGLAAKGKTASSILKHYYSRTIVESKPVPSSIRVGLLQERAEIWIEGDGRFDLHDRNGARRASGQAGERWRVVPYSTGRLAVFRPGSGRAVFTTGVPVTVRWEQYGTLLKLPQTGYTYKRGRLDVDVNPTTDKSRAILIVGFEAYLYGLGEMPSSWHTEALEAQAIAGRTYALEKVLRLGQQRPVCNCGVYASTADQAYVGRQHEVQRWTDAVKNTAGLVVTYADKPIQALYSSSSGGYTEHNEYVFGGSPLPYLRGKCDPGDYYGGDNPHSNWTVRMTDDQVSEEMKDAGRYVGLVVDIDYVAPRGVSGRLTPMTDIDDGGVRVEGTRGTQRMSGGTFRSILGLKSSLVHYHIYGGIRVRYDLLSCRPGLPKGNEFTWRDLSGTDRGRAQNFVSGRLFYNRSTGKVFWTMGAILKHYDYRRSKGQDLGLPITDEISVPGGRASYFERGRIYWSSGTGAHEVHGAILTRYLELGGPGGRLGLPTSDEYAISGGRRSDFVHGYITWNSSTKKTSYKITS
jgi:SpoIID/LytB domain protein